MLWRVLVDYIRRARTERRRFFTCTEDHPPPGEFYHLSLLNLVYILLVLKTILLQSRHLTTEARELSEERRESDEEGVS